MAKGSSMAVPKNVPNTARLHNTNSRAVVLARMKNQWLRWGKLWKCIVEACQNWAHNPKVAGSNPAPAITYLNKLKPNH